jgi:hypothetical protein
MAMDGGPYFAFAQGISLFVNCETQQEVDHLWEKLSEGGEPGQCGWLKDRFGVSWQIIPSALGELMQNKDPERSKRVMEAMLQMRGRHPPFGGRPSEAERGSRGTNGVTMIAICNSWAGLPACSGWKHTV